jgi:CheY-like chemotaxis protein
VGSGLEVLRRLKAAPETAGIPVHIFSARADEATRQAAREAGCDGYIIKPVALLDLLGAVRRALEAG